MKIWVDTLSGTYGDIAGLAIVDVPAKTLDEWDSGQASDSEIWDFTMDSKHKVWLQELLNDWRKDDF